jgi:hypothetical protein
MSAEDDIWQRRASAAAVRAARNALVEGVVPPGTPVGRLSDAEWNWIAFAAVAAWISTRAEEATARGLDTELTIRMTGYEPEPWDRGAVAAILPELATAIEIDPKPLREWSKETMVAFLTTAFALIRKAIIARDLGGGRITRQRDTKLNDPLPFV